MFKKILSFSCLLLLSLSGLYAVNFTGFHGGLNFASIDIEPPEGYTAPDVDSRVGFNAGFFADRSISPMSSIAFSVNYSQKGQKQEVGSQEYKEVYHAISAPVQFRLTSQQDAQSRFYVGGGLCANFLLSGSYEYDSGTGFTDDDDLEDLSSFELSAVFSAGIYFNNKFKAELMYDLGLSNILDSDSENAAEIKTRTLMLVLGIVSIAR